MNKPALCLLLVALVPAAGATARTWTSVSGATLDADYAGREGATILLEEADGKRLSIRIDQLSPADREYVRGLNRPVQIYTVNSDAD